MPLLPSALSLGTKSAGGAFTLSSDILTLTTAILGIRGSGKSTTASVIVEEALKIGHPVVVLDPLDCWWGLRSSADGKSPGFNVVIFGGPHGDLPLAEDNAHTIADLLVENPHPTVISLRHLSKSGQRRFVADFLERLYHRKGESEHRTALLVVIDECSSFIPQHVQAGETRTVGAIEDLVRRGRTSGFGVVLIDQRAASVNKDVLSQSELLIAHRHKSPHDRKALELWVAGHDSSDHGEEFLDSLAMLENGEAWFWYPSTKNDVFEKVRVRRRQTFDSGATPELGAKATTPIRQAQPDLAAWKKLLESTIQKAAENDPTALRKQVKRLEAELKQRPVIDSTHPQVQHLVREAVQRTLAPYYELAERFSEQVGADVLSNKPHTPGTVEILDRNCQPMLIKSDEEPTNGSNGTNHKKAAVPPPTKTAQVVYLPLQIQNKEEGESPKIGKGLRRMLTALATHGTLARKALGLLAGLSPKSGTFSNYLAAGRSNGWLEGFGDEINLTEKGRKELGQVEALPTGQALVRFWMDQVGGGCARMLHALVTTYPGKVGRSRLAQLAGLSPESGTFSNYLSKLRTLELIEGRGDLLVASKELFKEAPVPSKR